MELLNNEHLGKAVEKALCLALKTPYGMQYNYPPGLAESLAIRFEPLVSRFQGYTHTGAKSQLYDFTSADGSQYLSVKTALTEKTCKVCPQVIGQPSRGVFAFNFGLSSDATNDDIKKYIEENVASMMSKYIEKTFPCPMLVYSRDTDNCQIITMTQFPDWSHSIFTFTRLGTDWNESSSLKIAGRTIGEFQIHNHRSCIKFRWNQKGLFETFPDCFTIENIAAV
jgi:hypothetical protein